MNSNPENIPKYLYLNFQIWFPESKFKTPKYIKNVLVHGLRTPVLKYVVHKNVLVKTAPIDFNGEENVNFSAKRFKQVRSYKYRLKDFK